MVTQPPLDARTLAIGRLLRGIAVAILLLNFIFSFFGFSAFSGNPPASGTPLQNLDSDLLVISLTGLIAGQFMIYKARRGQWPLHPLVAAAIIIGLVTVALGPMKAFSFGLLMAAVLYKVSGKR